MRKLRLAGGVLAAGVLFAGSIFVASEQGEEIVTLTTFEANGSAVETRLWVVEDDGVFWLRAGIPSSGWFLRIEQRPIVEVEGVGRKGRYRAVPVRAPETRDRIHELMRAKYGFADRWISLVRDARGSVPVRLDPVESSD